MQVSSSNDALITLITVNDWTSDNEAPVVSPDVASSASSNSTKPKYNAQQE